MGRTYFITFVQVAFGVFSCAAMVGCQAEGAGPLEAPDVGGETALGTSGEPSSNGLGHGYAWGKPLAGSVGQADGRTPPGQGEDDGNAGYECDDNAGVGRSNPAHGGCDRPPRGAEGAGGQGAGGQGAGGQGGEAGASTGGAGGGLSAFDVLAKAGASGRGGALAPLDPWWVAP